jgi:hypothetical protein
MPGRPLLDMPGLVVETPPPRGLVTVWPPRGRPPQCPGTLVPRYGDLDVLPGTPADYVRGKDVIVRRDEEAEEALYLRVLAAGAFGTPRRAPHFTVRKEDLGAFVTALLADKFSVRAQGRLHRPSTGVSLAVRTERDWFDLGGTFEFDGQTATLPAILQAARTRTRTVELGDGSVGMLPEEWLGRFDVPSALGRLEGDRLRFCNAQGLVLDALLAANGTAQVDRDFDALRERLGRAEAIGLRPAPDGFRGTLRPYQQLGLAWLCFLGEIGCGGCLADDMGLGKTVQLLAFLLARERGAPSLVVAPSSVVFNWIREA